MLSFDKRKQRNKDRVIYPQKYVFCRQTNIVQQGFFAPFI